MYVCACDFFFPFKSCCSCLRRRRSRCKSKHAFLFCLSFYLQGDIQCQLLPFDRRQSPPGQNKFEKKKIRSGGREGRTPSAPMLGCWVSIPRAAGSQTYTTHLPTLKSSIFPSTRPAQAAGASTQGPIGVRGSRWLACVPVCRPHTTGAIFL